MTARLAYLLVCGAPPAGSISELVVLVQAKGWQVILIPTASAMGWLDVPALEDLTGHPVRTAGRGPYDTERPPPPHLVIVAPATFNTINKWASGINDTYPLGVLNEALGTPEVDIVVSPYAKPPLAAHPAFQRSLNFLRGCGVRLTDVEALRPDDADRPFRWSVVVDAVGSL